MVPPLGGLLVTVGFLADPATRHLAWIGLPLDCGFWGMLYAIPHLVKEAAKTSKSKLVSEMRGSFADIRCEIRLYKPDYYVITLRRTLPAGTTGCSQGASFGTWTENADQIALVSHRDKDASPSKMRLKTGLNGSEVLESTYQEVDKMHLPEFPPVGTLLQGSHR